MKLKFIIYFLILFIGCFNSSAFAAGCDAPTIDGLGPATTSIDDCAKSTSDCKTKSTFKYNDIDANLCEVSNGICTPVTLNYECNKFNDVCPTEFGCIIRENKENSVIYDANNNALVDTLCNVLAIAQGTAGRAFASLAVISVGIGFFTGKVSWGMMISVASGIACLFGSVSIVTAITGNEIEGCSGTTITIN